MKISYGAKGYAKVKEAFKDVKKTKETMKAETSKTVDENEVKKNGRKTNSKDKV